jgi:hypothetical protein
MKRTAAAFMLLASLGGCMHADRSPTAPNYGSVQSSSAKRQAPYQGPYGEPIVAGNNPKVGMSPGMTPATFVAGNAPKAGADLVQAGYLERVGADSNIRQVNGGYDLGLDGTPKFKPGYGVTPVPQMGPPGAVAAIGALPAYGPVVPTGMRTSILFGDPIGMKVTWWLATGWNDSPLVTPARYNFLQGGVYRLKLTGVADRVEKTYYPTLEVLPGSPKTMTYLAHSSVPVTFTPDDFEQVDAGNFLVKVIYLPDLYYQDIAVVAGPNILVSTQLEPGVDPIVEAQKRGTILAIVRMGNIDLNAPNSPAMDSPNPMMMRPPVMVVPGSPLPKKDDKKSPYAPPSPMPKIDNRPGVLPVQ